MDVTAFYTDILLEFTMNNIPLTSQQRFLLEGIEGGFFRNSLIPHAYQLSGKLDICSLKSSIVELVRRHSALRTRIITANEVPNQHIDSEPDEALNHSLDASPAEITSKSTLRSLSQQIISTDVDLAQDSLFYVHLLRIDDNEHILVVSIHHIIYDVHSLNLLLRDLWHLLLQFLEGNRIVSFDQPPQYYEYAKRQWQESATWIEKHSQYWRDHHLRFRPLEWPCEGRAPEATSPSRKQIAFSLERETSAKLRELARRERKPLAIVMLTIYAIAVSRTCNMNEFVIPISSLGHHFPSDAHTVGYFAYVLHFGVSLLKQVEFSKQLEHIYRDYLATLSHQDFGRVATMTISMIGNGMFGWFPASRGTFGSATVLGLLQSNGITVTEIPSLNVDEFPVQRMSAFNPYINFTENSENLRGSVIYRNDILPTQLVECLLQEIKLALQEAVH